MELKINKFEDVKNKFLKEQDQEYIDEVRYYEKQLILVIKKFDTHKELEENYLRVLDKVAAHIQDKIEDELDKLRWNIYLLFIIREDMSREKQRKLIKEIEIDKYCCKKYVLSNMDTKEINKEIEGKLPIFINLKKMLTESKDEIEINDNNEIKDESKKNNNTESEMPSSIKNYLKSEKKSLEEFLNLTFNLKTLNLIYKGGNNEN